MPESTNFFLNFYRKTLKHIKPLHRAGHYLLNRLYLSRLEKAKDFVTIQDDPFWFRYELLTGKHEAETVAVMKGLLSPGMTVLDIGAHAGYYSCLFAQLLEGEGKVFAFEPHPETYQILKKNVGKYPVVVPVQAAVSDQEGTAELYDYLMMSASGSLHYDESVAAVQKAQVSQYDLAPRLDDSFVRKEFSVHTISLDDFLPAQDVTTVDFIKMDIEGAELTALRGMRQLIANSPELRMIMEYNPQALKTVVARPEDAVTEVMAYGFTSASALQSDGAEIDLKASEVLTELTDSLMEKMGVVNILFSKV